MVAALLGVLLVLTGCAAGTATGSAPPAATPTATAAVQVAAPTSITIPAISVSSDLEGLGLNPDGTAAVPPLDQPEQASWFAPGVRPGQVGPAVVLGHVSSGDTPGVFYRLHELTPGDFVEVDRADDSVAVFQVSSVETFPKSQFPTARVWGDLPYAGLRLVTCGGELDESAGSFLSNVVAFAELVEIRDDLVGVR